MNYKKWEVDVNIKLCNSQNEIKLESSTHWFWLQLTYTTKVTTFLHQLKNTKFVNYTNERLLEKTFVKIENCNWNFPQ